MNDKSGYAKLPVSLLMAVLCLGTGALWALRSSANFTIPADTMDCGGGYATSSSHTLHGAVGGSCQGGYTAPH